MTGDFISPSDRRWSAALSAVEYDIYALPEYAELCAHNESATPVAFYACEGDQYCLIPLLLRPLPHSLGASADWSDAASPYGYSSALFRGCAAWRSSTVKAFVHACRANRIVTAFIRLHPLLPKSLWN